MAVKQPLLFEKTEFDSRCFLCHCNFSYKDHCQFIINGSCFEGILVHDDDLIDDWNSNSTKESGLLGFPKRILKFILSAHIYSFCHKLSAMR